MNRLLFWIFLYAPDWLLHGLLTVAAFCRSVWRVLMHPRQEVERYTGQYAGHAVTIGWIGTNEMKDHVLKMLYGGQYQMDRLPSTTLFHVRKTIRELSSSCDLIYVERFSILPPLAGFQRIKPVLNTWMEVDALNDLGSLHSSRAKRRLGKRKAKLLATSEIEYREFPVSGHPEQLRLFYEQLYVPHIGATYGTDCVESLERMKIFYAKGMLRLAYHRGEAISGTLFLRNRDTLISCKYGVRDPANKVHRASSSIHSYLAYAKQVQIPYFSAFHVSPFLSDGVFHYKRTCGLGVQRESRNYYRDRDLHVNVVNYGPGVIDFLRDNPFIYETNRSLVASLLCDGSAATLVEQIAEQYRLHRTPGIEQYQFHLPRGLTVAEEEEIYHRCGLTAQNAAFDFVTYRASCSSRDKEIRYP